MLVLTYNVRETCFDVAVAEIEEPGVKLGSCESQQEGEILVSGLPPLRHRV